MNNINKSKWFPFGINNNEGIKVFCFHHAGGSSIAFKEFVKNEDVNFIPIELPGRGTRIMEKCENNIYSLVNKITKKISEITSEEKYILYGHSMGALLAFLVEYNLENKYKKRAERLIVSGRQAPKYPDISTFKVYMGRDALIKEMKRLNGTPKEVFNNKELMDFMLPIIEKDYELVESYEYCGEKVCTPIYAYCSNEDLEANIDIMNKWKEVSNSTNTFEIKEMEGNHFFVYDKNSPFRKDILKLILGNK